MENEGERKELKTVSEVNLKEDFQSSGVADILAELDNSLIGLEPVKTRIKETASLLLVDKAREKLGLVNESPTLHMSFSGKSHQFSGKTLRNLKFTFRSKFRADPVPVFTHILRRFLPTEIVAKCA